MDNNSNTQTQLNTLRTLQQSYDALATASASGATATALENAKQAILDAIGAINIDTSDLAKQGSDSAVTLTEVSEKINNINSGVPQISIPDSGSAETVELSANTLYVFSNRTSDLTLTLGNPVQGEVSEYHFIIEVGSTLPTITLPTGLTWKSSNVIAFDVQTTYEASILDNYAIFVVW